LPVSNHSPALQKLVVIAQATLNLSNFKTGMAQARRFTLWAHNSEVKTGCRYFNIFILFEYLMFLLSLSSLSMHSGKMIGNLRYIVET